MTAFGLPVKVVDEPADQFLLGDPLNLGRCVNAVSERLKAAGQHVVVEVKYQAPEPRHNNHAPPL